MLLNIFILYCARRKWKNGYRVSVLGLSHLSALQAFGGESMRGPADRPPACQLARWASLGLCSSARSKSKDRRRVRETPWAHRAAFTATLSQSPRSAHYQVRWGAYHPREVRVSFPLFRGRHHLVHGPRGSSTTSTGSQVGPHPRWDPSAWSSYVRSSCSQLGALGWKYRHLLQRLSCQSSCHTGRQPCRLLPAGLPWGVRAGEAGAMLQEGEAVGAPYRGRELYWRCACWKPSRSSCRCRCICTSTDTECLPLCAAALELGWRAGKQHG